MQALSIHWPTQEIRADLGLPGYQPSRGTETSLAGGWGWKRWMTDRGQYDLECILDIGLKRNRHQKASKTESGSLRGFCCGPGSGRPELSDSCTNGRVVGILPYPYVMCSSYLWSPVDTSTSPSAPMMTYSYDLYQLARPSGATPSSSWSLGKAAEQLRMSLLPAIRQLAQFYSF